MPDPDDPWGVDTDGRWLLDRTFALFAEGLPWRPGALEALAVVRDSGVATALVTSTYRELTEVALDTIEKTIGTSNRWFVSGLLTQGIFAMMPAISIRRW